jgi:hypothetical protein
MSTATALACPFPDLLPYCSSTDAGDFWKCPRSTGTHWIATCGKIVAFRADANAPPSEMPSAQMAEVISRIIAAHDAVTVWMRMPVTMPAYSADHGAPCDSCRGTGLVPQTAACDACDGLGECPHCGHECDECDGSGRVSTGQPPLPCSTCEGTGKLPPPAVRILGSLLDWRYARRLVEGSAELSVNPTCRTPFLARMGGVNLSIMGMADADGYGDRCPELVLRRA